MISRIILFLTVQLTVGGVFQPSIAQEQERTDRAPPLESDESTEDRAPQSEILLPPAVTPNATTESDDAERPRQPVTSPRRQTTPPRRTIRLARAPNMFGDFFNSTPTLSFAQFLITDPTSDAASIDQSTGLVPGITQDPMFGGGPRLKISDNFSPIPRHRIYVQTHYFRNLFTTQFTNEFSTGGESGSKSALLTTLGVEWLSADESFSLEFRLPFLDAPTTANTLDSTFGSEGSQSSYGGRTANLSVILKKVMQEREGFLMSGGIGLNVPTAGDVSGNIGLLNYSVENGTTNLVPFWALLFQPQQNLFIQVYTQIDVPVGGDRFNFADASAVAITNPTSGSFGRFRESVLGSVDLQVARQLYTSQDTGWIQNLAGVFELRLTQALSRSGGVSGAGAALYSEDTVFLDYQQDNRLATYLNMTVGLQIDLRNDWHLRIGEAIPLINNNSFTAETMIQLEKRL